eukprot:27361_3
MTMSARSPTHTSTTSGSHTTMWTPSTPRSTISAHAIWEVPWCGLLTWTSSAAALILCAVPPTAAMARNFPRLRRTKPSLCLFLCPRCEQPNAWRCYSHNPKTWHGPFLFPLPLFEFIPIEHR